MINFKNTYVKLPNEFYSLERPTANLGPQLIVWNNKLSEDLKLDMNGKSNEELANIFSGKEILEGSEPLAMAYSGHQFGHFNPHLGDGRALLLGEIEVNEKQIDIQLKGSGQTKFSRRGDGRSSLGPVLREYIVSEAMHNLGVPGTRALAAVTTGEMVHREESLPGGILTRIASSHIRVGTFEYFASRQDEENLKILADYAISRHDPDLIDSEDSYLNFFKQVTLRKMDLVAKWMSYGFIHGVMNTDNTSISGETIDFGPCAFIDKFKKNKVFSSIDRNGRYAFDNQSKAALWNLSMLGNCLFKVIQGGDRTEEEAVREINGILKSADAFYQEKYLAYMCKKFGIKKLSPGCSSFVADYLSYLESEELDFTNSFRELCEWKLENTELKKSWLELIGDKDEALKMMQESNPVIIPRNHLIEEAIEDALSGDYNLFYELVDKLEKPFNLEYKKHRFSREPLATEVVTRTFCGT